MDTVISFLFALAVWFGLAVVIAALWSLAAYWFKRIG